ncbi:MAG TPA: phosphoribosylanthranilate isomerase [Candidatus Acidoferrum sp.]|nr:phosphoribosylanthranilate isomerase [Candidatus Acidoferrum sp.]
MIRIKICGITNLADAQAAADAGAHSLGFNFYEKSLRRVVTADAAQIRSKLPKEVEAVGVFVNAKPADINSLRSFVRFDAAQLHGDESPDIVSRVAGSLPVIKAFRVDANFSLSTFDRFPDAFAFLLDAARAGHYGGTGQTTDWDFARCAAASRRIILSGGLRVENVAEAIRLVRPYAVDVASGIETKPGKKDHAKMKEFISEVRRAEQQLEQQLETPKENPIQP